MLAAPVSTDMLRALRHRRLWSDAEVLEVIRTAPPASGCRTTRDGFFSLDLRLLAGLAGSADTVENVMAGLQGIIVPSAVEEAIGLRHADATIGIQLAKPVDLPGDAVQRRCAVLVVVMAACPERCQ